MSRWIGVYCGASCGRGQAYEAAAHVLGAAIARRGFGVVYGGGRAGLMGAVADGALAAGGDVVGVITTRLMDLELGHRGITRLDVVETMHERKMAMATRASAYIALPGGYGTLDELFEVLAWAQLGIHEKPIGLLNTSGFFDGLLAWLDGVEAAGFLRMKHRGNPRFVVDREAEGLLAKMAVAGTQAPT